MVSVVECCFETYGPAFNKVWTLTTIFGRFRYQRTRVQIQSLATFIEQLFTVNCP